MTEHRIVERLIARNYGCLKNVDIGLTSLHAFVGPNDSGKSTILQALLTVATLGWGDKQSVGKYGRDIAARLGKADSNEPTTLAAQLENEYFGLEAISAGSMWYFFGDEKIPKTFPPETRSENLMGMIKLGGIQINPLLDPNHPVNKHLLSLKGLAPGAKIVRFDPDSMRRESDLIPTGEGMGFLDDRGYGLAAMVDAVRERSNKDFSELEERVCALFDDVRDLQTKTMKESNRKVLGVRLKDGTEVGAEHLSEGLLYFIAFAALPYLAPTSMILVEEPENGLHPARIKEIMVILREISKSTQVVIATHSPLVINELEEEEVSVVWRTREEGTKVVRLKDTEDFELRSKTYLLGELWLSYADGETEKPLREGGPRP